MIMIQIDFSNEINLVLQISFKEHIIIELFLEVMRNFLLDRFISDLGSPSHGAVASRVRPPGRFKASAPNSSSVWLGVFYLRPTYLSLLLQLQRLWLCFLCCPTCSCLLCNYASSLIITTLRISLISHVLSGPSIRCDSHDIVALHVFFTFFRNFFRVYLLFWRTFAVLIFGDIQDLSCGCLVVVYCLWWVAGM